MSDALIEHGFFPSEDDPAAVPVCPGCLKPISPMQHYCGECGHCVGRLTPYIAFVNIPFNYSIFRVMWRQVWFQRQLGMAWKMFYVFLMAIVDLAAVMLLVGLPLLAWSKVRSAWGNRPGA